MQIRILAILATVGLLSAGAAELSAFEQVYGFTKRNHPTSATLKECPDGHGTLKDVPIVYGTPSFDGPAAKRWDESIDKYEIWPGGCVSMPDSPKVRPTCTTCGFGYDSEFRHWSRNSEDTATFKRPFSPLVSSFPKPALARQKGAFRYYQSVVTNRVVYQSVSFTSSESRDALITRINLWLKTNGITAAYAEKEHTVTFDGSHKLISDWQAEGISVMLHHTKKDGDSWVMCNLSSR